MNAAMRSVLFVFEETFPMEYNLLESLCFHSGWGAMPMFEEFIKLCEKYDMWDKVGSSYFDAKEYLWRVVYEDSKI